MKALVLLRPNSTLLLWVPETLHTSRDLLILVDDAAASVTSSDLGRLGSTVVGEWV